MKRILAFPLSLIALISFTSIADAARKTEPITGDIAPVTQELHWGDSVTFDASYEGELSKYQTIYISVICVQSTGVEYQWSGPLDFNYPLVDQAGDGLEVIYSEPGDCSATLVLRYAKGNNFSYTYLDTVSFVVGAV